MRYAPLFIVAIVFTACGGPAETAAEDKLIAARTRIRAMEDSLFEHHAFDQRSAQGMVDVYKAYAATNPLDSMAPEYLSRAAGMLKSMREPEGSLAIYDRLLENYLPGTGWWMCCT
ncbi:MAG: hypothetical protein IPM46_05310 [Flavobacteriales bacterium]|nr:hypothetical protein [Flavobacteriales bacterium]